MDDAAREQDPEEDLWEPNRNATGNVEISVNYLHANGRMTFDCVGLSQYRELLVGEKLDWQVKGRSRPSHHPSLEVLDAFVEQENQRRETPASGFSPALDEALRQPGAPRKLSRQRQAAQVVVEAASDEGGGDEIHAVQDKGAGPEVVPPQAPESLDEPEPTHLPQQEESVNADESGGAEAHRTPRRPRGAWLESFPDVEETARKMLELSEGELSMFRDSSSPDWGGENGLREQLAQREGVGEAAITSRMNGVYKRLGIPFAKKRKLFLQVLFGKFDQLKASGALDSDEVRQPDRPENSDEHPGQAMTLHEPERAQASALPPSGPPSVLQGVSNHGTLMIHLPPGAKRVVIEFS